MTEVFFTAEETTDKGCCDPMFPPLVGQDGSGDTWMTVGEPLDAEEELTVTVVFRRDPLDDFDTGEYLLRPLAPEFPGRA